LTEDPINPCTAALPVRINYRFFVPESQTLEVTAGVSQSASIAGPPDSACQVEARSDNADQAAKGSYFRVDRGIFEKVRFEVVLPVYAGLAVELAVIGYGEESV